MSGGFGRGRIVEQEIDSSYFPGPHFARVNNKIEGNRDGNNGARDSFAPTNSGFPSEDYIGDRGCRGSHGRSFSRDRNNDDNEYSCGRRSEFFCGLSTGSRGGFSSRYGGRGSGFLPDNNEKRGSSRSGGGRGGGFDAGSNLDDSNNFGDGDYTGGFSGGRRGGFGGFSNDSDSEDFANRNHGFRGDRIFSNNFRRFRAMRDNFHNGRNESFGKFGNEYSKFPSGRGSRSTHGLDNDYNNSGFEDFASRTDTEETSFVARDDFNSGCSSEGKMGFDRSNFNSDWSDRRSNNRRMYGNGHLWNLNRGRRTSFGDRVFEDGVGSVRFTSHVPEDRSIEEMYKEDAENAKYETDDLDQEVKITGVPKFQKLLKLDDWKNAGFGDLLLRNIIEKSCYSKPRSIQAAVIPLVQNGLDMIGHAETGSGKTAAFVLPIINHIMKNGEPIDSKCSPIALILAPTRELVGQLYNQSRKFADGTGVTVAKAYGQYKFVENIMELERGCNMLFATMGRLIDFVEHRKVKLHNIRFLVLDEADRMLGQDSFQTDIMSLIHNPSFPSVKDRQTLLFSATFTREVQELAAKVLKENHAFVSNGKVTAANPLVEQNFIEVTSENKFDKLIQLLEEDKANNGDVSRTLVFVERKQMADVIALNLVQKNIRSSSISGDRVQKQREEALADFRKGNINVLVATDVCARGIDVKDLQHVINYDMPKDRVTYVHRIGRTGRLHRGKATSFINLGEQDPTLIADIVQVVREVQQIPPDFLLDIANDRIGGADYMENRRSDDNDFAGKFKEGFSKIGRKDFLLL
ncbi:unnamed protein product [Cercopithifilaria johnstoni]|uniref:RNA helicase n=1 Tax=Cercopithifilaria johnstoni TaxID=2874296 RepID=A0A8J2MDY8_9BILA|nr:unnamed protein product [Cercopithifilaria johnstoni]